MAEYFDGYFGPSTDYFDDYFDPDAAPAGPPSANGGSSKAKILGTQAPRPQVPPWRALDRDPKAVSMMVTEMRNYLSTLHDRAEVFGNHIEIQFADDTTPVRVDTGLGGPPKGYKQVSANGDIRVYSSSPPSGVDPTPERGIVWLKAAYDPATLPAGKPATVTLYIY